MTSTEVQKCLETCSACAALCHECSDACDEMGGMDECSKLCKHCASVCEQHDHLLRQGDRSKASECISSCGACAFECDKGADHMEICRRCADACRRCAEACQLAESSRSNGDGTIHPHVGVASTHGENVTQASHVTDHIVAVFASHVEAEAAIKGLSNSGYNIKNLSIIGQNYRTEEHPVGFVNTGDRMWSWGQLGAFWGSIWGLMFGSAMMFIPGIGHVMFAGWLVAALQGALIGGGIAALGGALASIGVAKDTVVEYESALKAGSFLVLAHGTLQEVNGAKDILARTPATRVDTYSSEHRHSWGH